MFWLKLATSNSPNNWKPSPHFQLQLTVWSGNSTQYLCVSTNFFGGKFFAVYIQVTHCKENKAEAVQLLSSAKLTLKQLITKAKVSELEFHMTKKSFLSSNEQPSCTLVMDRKTTPWTPSYWHLSYSPQLWTVLCLALFSFTSYIYFHKTSIIQMLLHRGNHYSSSWFSWLLIVIFNYWQWKGYQIRAMTVFVILKKSNYHLFFIN